MDEIYSIPSFSGEDESWNWPSFDTGSDASSSSMYSFTGSTSNSNTASLHHPNLYPMQHQQNPQQYQQYRMPSYAQAQAVRDHALCLLTNLTVSLEISMASHADLVMANNTTYIDLLQRYSTLTEQHRRLQSSTAQHAPQSASSSSLHPPTMSLPSTSPLFILPGATDLADPKEFPLVRWWNRADFTRSQPKKKTTTMNSESGKRGGSRAAKDINVMHQYLENEDGTEVSGLAAKAMRGHQRTIFREIKKRAPDELPATWGNASLSVVNYHRSEMYKAYPSLRLCLSHWKLDLMATTAYPSWYKKNVKNKQTDFESDSDSEQSDANNTPPPSSTIGSSSSSASSSNASGRPKLPAKRTKKFTSSQQPKKRKTMPSPSPDPSPPPEAATTSSNPSSNSSALSSSASPSVSAASPIAAQVENSTLSGSPAVSPSSSTMDLPSLAPLADSSLSNPTNSSVTAPTTTIVNPIDEEFGPPSGPTQRSDAADAAVASNPKKANKQAKKRPSKSSTPENLFYIDYLRTNSPVTAVEFKTLFSKLTSEELEGWKKKSTEQARAKKDSRAQATAAAEGVASGSSTW
ncbi:hypothetical protein B0H16DRAFT_1810742 [Mycena metata]|uniref:Uncharacterized protein n=1 Tax=Mycena metata TaxID=1033252 RepID=A0AAD7H6M2_9AGAR|nr:hypothetical protein B0H16DRAFT_1810742 [Mycena metata]